MSYDKSLKFLKDDIIKLHDKKYIIYSHCPVFGVYYIKEWGKKVTDNIYAIERYYDIIAYDVTYLEERAEMVKYIKSPLYRLLNGK